MKTLNGGELVVERLKMHGIRQIFSIIGGQMGTIYDAIGRSGSIGIFVPRNETAAPIMAAGYTATSGIPAVSMATVGAGVVYEVAGLLKAWLDYLPIISIAPQVQSYKIKPHQESLQSCNQDELFFPITKWNTIVYHWDRIPQMIDRGVREAVSGVPGPVHIDIPVNVLFQNGRLSGSREKRAVSPPGKTRYTGRISGAAEQLAAATQALVKARKPLIIAGQGFGRPDRYPEIRAVLKRLAIPVVTTTPSSGILNGSDGCHAGNLSLYAGSAPGMNALKDADLWLIVGIDRYSKSLICSTPEARGSKGIVQIETDPAALLNGMATLYPVYADPITALELFDRAIKGGNKDYASWNKEFIGAGDTAAADLAKRLDGLGHAVKALSELTSGKDIIVADGELPCHATAAVCRKAQYKNLFAMDRSEVPGAGLPFAVGAAIANPDGRVVLVCDRQALFYHLRELQPVASNNIGLKLICLDDGGGQPGRADLAAVLTGLACRVATYSPQGEGMAELMSQPSNQPSALLVS